MTMVWERQDMDFRVWAASCLRGLCGRLQRLGVPETYYGILQCHVEYKCARLVACHVMPVRV